MAIPRLEEPANYARFSVCCLNPGVAYTHFAWAGGTFFPVVLSCQFSVLAGNRFWFYILLMYLEYHTVVVLCWFFLIWREIVFGKYVLSVQYSCAVVSVFLLWQES